MCVWGSFYYNEKKTKSSVTFLSFQGFRHNKSRTKTRRHCCERLTFDVQRMSKPSLLTSSDVFNKKHIFYCFRTLLCTVVFEPYEFKRSMQPSGDLFTFFIHFLCLFINRKVLDTVTMIL